MSMSLAPAIALTRPSAPDRTAALASAASAAPSAPAPERATGADRTDRAPFPRWGRSWPARAIRLGFQQMLLFPLQASVCGPLRIEGREHLDGLASPVIFVANHASHLDTPTVLAALPPALRPRVAVAAAADYFYRDRRLGAVATLAFNTFPFVRRGSPRASLAACRELIEDSWSILLYPEGTRSTTGVLGPFKRGVGLLARVLGVPVVPIAIDGTAGVLPKGRVCPRPGPLRVRIGAPILVPPDIDSDTATDLVRSSVLALLSNAP